MKNAFLFPGQGSQFVGMGKDIYEKYDEAKEVYDRASEILGIDVPKLCFEIDEEELNKTQNAQIAILVTSLAIAEVIRKKGIDADVCAGLSLGEYTALIYSGYLSLEEGIKLIQKRGYYMQNFIPDEKFKMVAVMGLESSVVEEVCSSLQKEGMFVAPANYNYTGQTVISGNLEAVEKAEEVLKDKGAKRLVELKTSGPFHTSKLSEAKELFAKELENADFVNGDSMVIKNIDGKPYTEDDNIKEILASHMVSPVRFDKETQYMEKLGIDNYIEIGPGKTLVGFVRKGNKEANVFSVCNLADLERLFELVLGV